VANKSAADMPVTSPCASGPDKSAACWCGGAQDKPAAVEPGAALDNKPVAAPGKPAAETAPVAAENNPAVAPCAALHDKPVAAPCGAAVPERPAVAVVPGKPEAVPCGAIADKPMVASDNAASDKPVGPACGAAEENPIAAPGKSVSITPLAGPGKAARKSASRPGRLPTRRDHAEALAGKSPVLVNKGRQDCVTLGTGFECPGGAIPHHRTHLLKLAAHSRPNTAPHRLRCVDTEIPEANHTRMARPVAARDNLTIRRLPTTGGSSALLALMGFGLAGAGVVLYRFGRARRSEEG
jgi:LPXTG-motif cell wall-anchored protein